MSVMIDFIQGDERFSALLDQAFSVPAGAHYLDDFPVWRGAREGVLKIGAMDGAELASCAGARLAKLKTPSGALPVAVIGAVATDPRYRGKGYASSCVEVAVDWARGKGAALALLWGSEHALYRRLGFELCGEQSLVRLASLHLSGQGTSLLEGWCDALFEQLAQRPSGLAISPDDRAWMSAHKNVKWFRLEEAGRIRAYAAIGRGIDLHGIVHEWGGEPRALESLLVTLRTRQPELSLLASPSEITSRGWSKLRPASDFLCMAQVLDQEKTLQAYGLPAATVGNMTVRTLFGPRDETAAFPAAPLPLWIWGLDAA